MRARLATNQKQNPSRGDEIATKKFNLEGIGPWPLIYGQALERKKGLQRIHIDLTARTDSNYALSGKFEEMPLRSLWSENLAKLSLPWTTLHQLSEVFIFFQPVIYLSNLP